MLTETPSSTRDPRDASTPQRVAVAHRLLRAVRLKRAYALERPNVTRMPLPNGTHQQRLSRIPVPLTARICLDQMEELFADARGVEVDDRALTRMTRQLVT
jgi:hypothetical protein